jgi:membrane protein
VLKKWGEFLRKLKDTELAHYASSLSFHTILSLIPILLITFSIFTKMPSFQNYYEKVQSFIFNSLIPTQQELLTGYLNQFMENTINMGALGLLFVLYISVMFFLDYEKIVSKIFEVPTRSFWEAIATYWTMLTLMPLGLAISFYTSSLAQDVLQHNTITSSIDLFQFSPYLVIWALYLVMYTISAKVKIHLKSALIASFIASLIWYVSKNLFIYYVAYNQTYLSIYGSFSILLFFFLWIYFSWFIYLYGLKLCFLLNENERAQSQDKEKNEELATPNSQE